MRAITPGQATMGLDRPEGRLDLARNVAGDLERIFRAPQRPRWALNLGDLLAWTRRA